MSGFRHVGDRRVHDGAIWDVVVADFEAPDGTTFRRDIVRSPGAVAVVPLIFDPEGNPSVVLVRQYRPAYDRMVTEIPAGMRDVEGEPPELTGRRELAEEAGLEAGEMSHLCDMFPSVGMTDAVTSIYLATDCRPVDRRTQGPEEQYSELLHVPLVDAVAMILSGEIADSKSIAGLLLTERRLGRRED